MGTLAARTLLTWIRGTEPASNTKILLPVEFIPRGTTAPRRTE
jgi:DNA-binding LacI/PurR family transcriptional regulator